MVSVSDTISFNCQDLVTTKTSTSYTESQNIPCLYAMKREIRYSGSQWTICITRAYFWQAVLTIFETPLFILASYPGPSCLPMNVAGQFMDQETS